MYRLGEKEKKNDYRFECVSNSQVSWITMFYVVTLYPLQQVSYKHMSTI